MISSLVLFKGYIIFQGKERAAWLLAAAEIEIQKAEISDSWSAQELKHFENRPESD